MSPPGYLSPRHLNAQSSNQQQIQHFMNMLDNFNRIQEQSTQHEQQEQQEEPSNDGYNASEESTDEEFEPPIITQPYRFPPHTPGRPMRFRFNSALQPTVYTNFFQVPINRSLILLPWCTM